MKNDYISDIYKKDKLILHPYEDLKFRGTYKRKLIVKSLPLNRRIKVKLSFHFPVTYRGLWTLKNLILYQKQEEHKETAFRFKRDHARSAWTYDNQSKEY